MPPHILITMDDFSEAQLQTLAEAAAGWATLEFIPGDSPAEVQAAKVAESEIVIGWPKPEWILNGETQLLIVPSHGFDQFQGFGLEAKPGFVMCNARGAYSVSVAEHCLALIVSLGRRIPQHARDMRDHQWRRRDPYPQLTGSSACIVGLGSIGTEIARRLMGLGVHVSAVDVAQVEPLAGIRRLHPIGELRQAVAEADHVIAAVFGGPATVKLFDAALFDAMKPGAHFYNISRGSVVDQVALIERLQSGHLGGAGLDVTDEEPLPPDSPLWDMENVMLTPHVAGSSERSMANITEHLVTNLTNFRDGKPLNNVVKL